VTHGKTKIFQSLFGHEKVWVECILQMTFVLDFDLGSSKSDSSILEVRDQSNNLLTTESITAFANTCTAYQL
jgi:hypothetical protein